MKCVFLFIFLFFSLSSSTYANPTVKVTTASFGVTQGVPFTVNVKFSEDVTGFNALGVTVGNGTVTAFTGSNSNYSVEITPINAGKMSVFIPANTGMNCKRKGNTTSNLLPLDVIDPAKHPSSNINLLRYDLVTPLPLGAVGHAVDIDSRQLNGNPRENTGYSNPPYFYTDFHTGAMVFFAPTGGATTPNSENARSELAETEELQWMVKTPYRDNFLQASLKVQSLAPAPDNIVIIGQIHCRGNTDPEGHEVSKAPLVKILYSTNATVSGQACDGCVYAEIRPTPASEPNQQLKCVIKTGIPLNTLFTYSIDFSNDGRLTLKADEKSFTIVLSTNTDNTLGWGSQNFLFHAGVYLKNSGTSLTEGARASFYSLNLRHTA